MQFEVLGIGGSPPALAGTRHLTSISADGRWTLEVGQALPFGMGAPWRGTGSLIGPRGNTDLGKICFPTHEFEPWMSGDQAAWMDHKGRAILVHLDDPTHPTSMRAIRGKPSSVVCNGDHGIALHVFGLRQRALTWFDSSGETKGELRHRNLFESVGFTSEGSAVLAVVQQRWRGPPELTALHPLSGQMLARESFDDLKDVEVVQDKSGGLPLTRADQEVSFARRPGFVSVRFDHLRGVLWVGREQPTGETAARFGRPHAISEIRWTQIALS